MKSTILYIAVEVMHGMAVGVNDQATQAIGTVDGVTYVQPSLNLPSSIKDYNLSLRLLL